MKRLSFQRLTTIAAAIVLSVMLAPTGLQAQGVSGVPSAVNLDDALRGSTVFQPFSLIHTFEETVTWEIRFEGDATPYLSAVTRSDRETPVTEAQAEPGEQLDFELRIDIPDDLPNGTYEAFVFARVAPLGDSAVGVGTGVAIPVALTVTGTQRLEGSIVDAQYFDAEVGEFAHMKVRVGNTGNVIIQPRIVASIEREGEPISEVVRSDVRVFPGSQVVVELDWDTTDERTGPYDVVISGAFEDLDLGSDSGVIEVLARGVFSRSGRLDSLDLINEPQSGGAARLAATIVNTGAIESRVTFVGEVLRDGQPVEGILSAERFLLPDESGVIQFLVQTPTDGAYVVKGVANFEGTDTDELALEFTVGDLAAGEEGSDSSVVGIGIGVGAVAIAGLGYLFFRRRRTRSAAPKA